jgi:hypothetical protein
MSVYNGICPKCKQKIANGVGPEAIPELTKILNDLPSSHVFRDAADDHDVRYHYLGGGKMNGELKRRYADDCFFNDMMSAIELKCHWYSKWWYRLQAKRNFSAVREFGNNFYSYEGCDG